MTTSRKNAIAQGARRGRTAPAGEDVLAQGASALARAGFPDASLILRWHQIAGLEVARVAQPVKFQEAADGAVLTLRCAPGAAVLLQHETRALIERVNAYVGRGRIVRLRFVAGAAAAPGPEPARHPGLGIPNDAESAETSPGLEGAIDRLNRRRKAVRKAH